VLSMSVVFVVCNYVSLPSDCIKNRVQPLPQCSPLVRLPMTMSAQRSTCPVCGCSFKSLDKLERHVDSHFEGELSDMKAAPDTAQPGDQLDTLQGNNLKSWVASMLCTLRVDLGSAR
jgi:hypothetical protein